MTDILLKKSTPLRFIDSNKDKAQFFATLRKRVDAYFKENGISKFYNAQMVIKTVVFLSLYLGSFALILGVQPSLGIGLLFWTMMGFSKAGIGMCVMHDANHGAYSSSHKVNYWLGHTLNLVGGSVFNWKLQHNVLHHTFTNIVHMDDDVEDKGVLRFSPHTKLKWFHKLQYIYAFGFYGILTLYWAILKDFVQYFRYKKIGVNKQTDKQNRGVLVRIILSKVIYFAVFFVLPIGILHIPASHIIVGFLLMHFIAGVVLTVIFQLAHSVEDASHPVPNAQGDIENNWAIHQLNTTVNFSRNNAFISWYLGGLNFQVEHHLFPTLCHVHYPEISKIVKTTANEYNIPYLENETFLNALYSHVLTLKRFGRLQAMRDTVA